MWLEVPLPHTDYYVTWSSAFPLPHMEYSLAWSSASAQGIYWDLKFGSSGSAYRIVFDLGALKWRNSASAQGKYCDLEVTQFRLHTINLVRLEVSQFRFHTRALTFKSRNSASAQRTSCDLKFRFRTRNILCLEVQQFCFRTQNNLWLEVPQFCKIYCDLNFRSSASAKKRRHLKFRTSASAREHNFFFGKSTLIQPPTHFLIFVMSYMTYGPCEGQRNLSNREAPGKSRR